MCGTCAVHNLHMMCIAFVHHALTFWEPITLPRDTDRHWILPGLLFNNVLHKGLCALHLQHAHTPEAHVFGSDSVLHLICHTTGVMMLQECRLGPCPRLQG